MSRKKFKKHDRLQWDQIYRKIEDHPDLKVSAESAKTIVVKVGRKTIGNKTFGFLDYLANHNGFRILLSSSAHWYIEQKDRKIIEALLKIYPHFKRIGNYES